MSEPTTVRRITLAKRPEGMVTDDCFAAGEAPRPTPGDGEALVRNLYLSIDPTIRGWIERDGYLPAVAIGDVVRSATLGEVVASNNPAYPVGARVLGMAGWETHSLI